MLYNVNSINAKTYNIQDKIRDVNIGTIKLFKI